MNLKLLILVLVCAAGAHAAEPYPKGQLSDDVVPSHYALDLTIDPAQLTFTGKVSIDVTLNKPTDLIWLHGRGLTVTSAVLTDGADAIPATWTEIPDSDGVAKLTLAHRTTGTKARIDIAYSAAFNPQLEGLYRSVDNGEAYIFSQMEPISARVAFPGFDEPRFKTPYDIALTVPAADAAISNSPEISTAFLAADVKRVQFATTKPLPTYLVAAIVGPFDVVEWDAIPASAVRAHAIPLRGIATKGKGRRLKFALANTAGLLLKLEEYFGIAYPFDKLDIIAATDFSAGAMENAGAIVYREGLLLMDDDASLSQKRRYVGTHTHEMAHQWVGDLVTPAWWNDIWLNESFATWMSDKVAAQWDPKGEYDRSSLRGALGAMSADAKTNARRIAQPIATNDDIENAFDTITYEKGGGVLSMFEQYYGVEAFRKGVQLHLQRHAYGTATAGDFLQSVADANNDSKGAAAFATFLNQPGVPLVAAELKCGSTGNSIAVRQSRYIPKKNPGAAARQTWKVPLCIAYGTGDARHQTCKLIEERSDTIALEPGACPAWIMPNADGAGYYRFSLDKKAWSALAAATNALTDKEVLATLDSLDAALVAGNLDIASYLDGVKAVMARNGGNASWDAASALTERLIWIKKVQASDRSRPQIEKFIAALYEPLFKKVGLDATSDFDRDNPVQATLLRGPAVTMVAVEGRAQPARGELARRGAAYVGVDATGKADGNIHAEAVNPNLIGPALTVAVQDIGAPVVDAIFERLKTERDGTVRAQVLGALTRSIDPPIAARVRELALSGDLRVNEIPTVVFGAMAERENALAGWAWFKKNYDTIKKRMPNFSQSGLAAMGARFCGQAERDDYANFFRTRIGQLTGGPRVLSAALEGVDQCIALTTAQRGQTEAYFDRH